MAMIRRRSRRRRFMCKLDESLIGEFFSYQFKFGIPIFAKATDERFLEEFVDGEIFLLSFQYGHLAHVPTVIVKSTVRTIFAHTNGVEVARYGFIEWYSALTIGALNGTVAATLLVVAGEYAVFAIDDRGDEFATGIVVGDALTLDDFACFGQ